MMTEDQLRVEFERQHAGRNLKRHNMRGTYVSPPIAALWNQHKRTAAWVESHRDTQPAGEPVAWVDEKSEALVFGGWDKKPFANAYLPVFYAAPTSVAAVASGDAWPTDREVCEMADMIYGFEDVPDRAIIELNQAIRRAAPIAAEMVPATGDAERVAREAVEQFKAALYRVPGFGNRVSKEVREKLTEAHCIMLNLPALLDKVATGDARDLLVSALKRLSFAAQTSGGTVGPDDELMAAIAQAETALSAAMSASTAKDV